MAGITAQQVYDYINGAREFVPLPADSTHSRDTAEGSEWMYNIRRQLKMFDPQSISMAECERLHDASSESIKNAACGVLKVKALQLLKETLDGESLENLDSLILDFQPVDRKI